MRAKYRKTENHFYKIRGNRYTIVALYTLFTEAQIETGLLPINNKILSYPVVRKNEYEKAFKIALKKIKNLI